MKITLNNFVLADSPDPVPMTNLRINGARLVQEAAFLRAVARGQFDRGNRRTEIMFETTRLFKSQLEAETFLLEHETNVPGSGLLVFVAGQKGKSTATRYLKNAVVESVSSAMTGCTTRHSYRIVGGVMKVSSN
jgi:hypothetical protein